MDSYIKLHNVNLDYILKTGASSIRKALLNTVRKLTATGYNHNDDHQTFRALNNINLNIQTGDKLGIFGCNGAGKSSLLRVLAGIYKPSSGNIAIAGNSSCLFDISLGLDPEANGIENIITMCVLRGMTKHQAIDIVDDIANFTELGDFLYKPIRMYSSGMGMKLAFAVATAGNPDILLVDEVIGVGDAKFMQKAVSRIHDLMHRCKILVLTSHDNELVRSFCNKAIVLDKGHIIYQGGINEAIDTYNHLLYDNNTVVTQEKTTAEAIV